MSAFRPDDYGAIIAECLTPQRLPSLGPGVPRDAMRSCLSGATTGRLFADTPIRDPGMAEACRSGLWLYHDFLDESHTISQGINTTTGSYWHGIMHRREPDFSNAGYWFRRVGTHPIFPALAEAARSLSQGEKGLVKAGWLTTCSKWDPFAFIDLCESVHATPGPDHDLCRRVSLAEWELLFDYSYRQATGT